jgi:hypothetical protein
MLNCMILENLYGFHGEITGDITNAYVSAAKPEIIKLLTSSDLFGNPNHFRSGMSEGYAEMMDGKDGFNNGIMAGAGGMVKGGTGLAQNAVGAGAGSISRMTKALNKPLTYLTFDTEYIHKKEIRDLKEKPKDLF